MSDCGEETTTAGSGSGQCVTTTLHTVVTSESVAVMTTVQSVTPAAAAAADSLPDVKNDEHDDDDDDVLAGDKQLAEVDVSGDMTSAAAPVRIKSQQSSRKRYRQSEVSRPPSPSPSSLLSRVYSTLSHRHCVHCDRIFMRRTLRRHEAQL